MPISANPTPGGAMSYPHPYPLTLPPATRSPLIPSASLARRIWRVGAYIRLSRDDGNDESLSVANQKKIISEYLESAFPGEYLFAGNYIDDSQSGTDYERPAFLQMLKDLDAGIIDCIVCKNLSRMFRNYADQGYFLEKVFPQKGTRFITISEPRVDSFLHPETIGGLEIPINGLMNDRYAAKTSLDIRSTFATKRRKGEFIGAFAPYGYQKSPDNKNLLIPDPEAADIVQSIFRWFLYEGMSKNAIARRLNQLGIPNPTAYKQRKGLHYHNSCPSKNDGLWSPGTISAILKNPVYIGTMVQGRQTVISYKVHQKVTVPSEEWIVVPGSHEPILSLDIFEQAQKLQKKHTRATPKTGKLHLFSGLIRCGDCQKAMSRHSAKGIVYYQCRTYQEKSRKRCAKNTIREDKLYCLLLSIIQTLLCTARSAGQLEGIIQGGQQERMMQDDQQERMMQDGQQKLNLQLSCLDRLLKARRRDLERAFAITDNLYADWKNGDITREEYLRMKEKYSAQASTLKAAIESLQTEYQAACEAESAPDPQLAAILQDGTISQLNRGLLITLLDHICIYRNKEVELWFAFADPGVSSYSKKAKKGL